METQEIYEARRMQVVNYILEHPERFNMLTWGEQSVCGTVACLAGTAVLQAEQQGLCVTVWETDGEKVVMNGVTPPGYQPGYKVADADDFARRYLGMKDNWLFYDYSCVTPEMAAKKLLDAPYITEPEIS